MADDDNGSTNIIQLNTTPSASRKNRNQSPSPSTGKHSNSNDEHRRPLSKLPSLPSKANLFASPSDSLQLKRYRSQLSKDFFSATSTRFERQATTINPQTRLPTLYALTHDNDYKRLAESRRRQIYALNHLMRELEQEQFREFCKSHNIGVNNSEIVVENNNEETNNDPSV